MSMFCFQCSEAAGGEGCSSVGICGKQPETASLQDLLIWTTKGLSYWAEQERAAGREDDEANLFTAEALFTTITNVNFDPERVKDLVERSLSIRDRLAGTREKAGAPEAAVWRPEKGRDSFEAKGWEVGVLSTVDPDIRSLRELLVYGLKGIAAYADHAYILKHSSTDVFAFLQKGLAATLDDSLSADDYVALVMDAGKHSVDAMALLDSANTGTYGHPELTEVFTGTYEGPGILVSGHDLLDLEELLKQTEGSGIRIYTHGEMLPAHAYPGLKKYDHLAGNFGGAWWSQQKEFADFEGAILMTTNCLQKPKPSYQDRIFTTGLVAWPGIGHIPGRSDGGVKDFSPVIEAAKKAGPLKARDGKSILIGFAHEQTGKLADSVIEAVKAGHVKRFVVMAGCDGRVKEREYYTEVAKNLPKETVIMTAGCAKYRYNMLDLGETGGIPRLIDAGQCNDSYSLVVTALKLKEALGLDDINDLPISYDLAWYEQKAVAVLLALLYLGVKGIRLGPVLPAFLSPNVAKVLVENFHLKPIGDVEGDLQAIAAGA